MGWEETKRDTHQDEDEGPHDEGDRDDAVEEGEVGRDVGEVVEEDDSPDEDEGEAIRHHEARAQREHARAHDVRWKHNIMLTLIGLVTFTQPRYHH